jgi:hypothetical protein
MHISKLASLIALLAIGVTAIPIENTDADSSSVDAVS